MFKRLALLVSLSVFLHACAGSPVHTSSLSTSELASVDNHTLCKAATPRELYSPNYKVLMEVQRRGLNCSAIYHYNGAQLDNAVRVLKDIQQATNPQGYAPQSSSRAVAIYSTEYQSGLNKICIYSRNGNDEAYTFKRTDICPRALK